MSNIRAISYLRVSTDKQERFGTSLESQEIVNNTYAQYMDIDIIQVVKEDYSSKDFNRPEWKKLMAFIKKNKGAVNMILVSRWDRFSRNIEHSYDMISRLKKLGVYVQAAEQSIDMDSPGSTMLLAVYLAMPHESNNERSRAVTEGQKRRMINGHYPYKLPLGYTKNIDGEVIHSEDALAIEKIFNLANLGFRKNYIIQELKVMGYEFRPQRLDKIIKNSLYTGIIDNPLLDTPVDTVFKSIVDKNTFYKVQEKIYGTTTKELKTNPDTLYPLKGVIRCPTCDGKLTGYQKKKASKYFYYYKCNTKKCGYNISAKILHTKIEQQLENIQLDERLNDTFQAILKTTFKKAIEEHRNILMKKRTDLTVIDSKIEKIKNKYLYEDLDKSIFDTENTKLLKEKVFLEMDISNLIEETSNPKYFTESIIKIIGNLKHYWVKLPLEPKQQIIKLIYPKGISYIKEKHKYRTPQIGSIFAFTAHINRKVTPKGDSIILSSPQSQGIEPNISLHDFKQLFQFIEKYQKTIDEL